MSIAAIREVKVARSGAEFIKNEFMICPAFPRVAAGQANGIIPLALAVLQNAKVCDQVVGTVQPFLANISELYSGLLNRDWYGTP
ncbi:unannotated protein [freshwater metagenome]|uniref:Unannotated protein n=1 Tax=freshwater metagenome TaxID=449393 RepID=A0A6J7PLM4_9ZZZZ